MPAVPRDQLAIYTNDLYKAEYKMYKEVKTKYDMIYTIVNNVKGGGDKETQLLGVGRFERHTIIGQEIKFKSPKQGWDYFCKYHRFSSGLALEAEAVEDSLKVGDLLNKLASGWGKMHRIEKETWGARPFNEGGNLSGDVVFNGSHYAQVDTQGDLPYDGYPLFTLSGNARAVKGSSTTFYNSIASLTLTPSNFEQLYNLATAVNNRDEMGEVAENPVDTLLVKKGSDSFLAKRIVGTPFMRGLPNTQLNDANVYADLVSPIDWDYLESTAGFFIGKKKHPDWQFRERQGMKIRFFRDEKTLGYYASANFRYGVMIMDWRPWVRGGGTSA